MVFLADLFQHLLSHASAYSRAVAPCMQIKDHNSLGSEHATMQVEGGKIEKRSCSSLDNACLTSERHAWQSEQQGAPAFAADQH